MRILLDTIADTSTFRAMLCGYNTLTHIESVRVEFKISLRHNQYNATTTSSRIFQSTFFLFCCRRSRVCCIHFIFIKFRQFSFMLLHGIYELVPARDPEHTLHTSFCTCVACVFRHTEKCLLYNNNLCDDILVWNLYGEREIEREYLL